MGSSAVPLRPLSSPSASRALPPLQGQSYSASSFEDERHSRTATVASMRRTASPSGSPPPARDGHADLPPTNAPASKRLNASFFLFGLLNNSLYVVILTAALELLPQGVPTGLVSLANILPALIAKAVWPYLLKGTVRYTRRIWACAFLSFVGMMTISIFSSLSLRLLGISFASFSSGLGELTFLQLSTRYAPKAEAFKLSAVPTAPRANYAGDGVGWFASGTGAAGLVGAAAWWIVRPLGIRMGLGLLSLLPFLMVGAYLLLLPSVESLLDTRSPTGRGAYEAVSTAERPDDEDQDQDDDHDELEERDQLVDEPTRRTSSDRARTSPAYGTTETAARSSSNLEPFDDDRDRSIRLSFSEKMALLKPMLWPYILPLVTVYFAEYTINQGVAPTLIYPLPTSTQHPLLSLVIKKLSDYYPLYQLVYQSFVFLSRSSVSILRLPAIPKQFLWIPAILQTMLLVLLTTESLHAWFKASIASPLVIVLICVEGLAGGGAYVSVFYSIGLNEGSDRERVQLSEEDADGADDAARAKEASRAAKRAQEHEFRIGCVGFGDSLGILVASLVAMPLQVDLCNRQVQHGRNLCKQV